LGCLGNIEHTCSIRTLLAQSFPSKQCARTPGFAVDMIMLGLQTIWVAAAIWWIRFLKNVMFFFGGDQVQLRILYIQFIQNMSGIVRMYAKICHIKCQTKCQNYVRRKVRKKFTIKWHIECQNIHMSDKKCQVKARMYNMSDRMTDRMSKKMPDRMPNKMPEKMPDHVSGC
jgi:hypothetical protein